MRKIPSITILWVAMLGLSGFSSLAYAEAPQPPSNPGSIASDLVKTPVTKIFPGDVDLAPKVKSPVADDAAAADRGRQYFSNFNCIGCHADNGGGGMGPALSNRSFIYGGSAENIYLTISQGRPNGMPAWGAILPSNVIWDLAAYVQSISKAPETQWGKTTSLDALKIEQVPAEFKATPDPWKFTEPFTDGQKPGGE
jgi:cytochrome c oxidase cbb3-type subunit III